MNHYKNIFYIIKRYTLDIFLSSSYFIAAANVLTDELLIEVNKVYPLKENIKTAPRRSQIPTKDSAAKCGWREYSFL